VNLSALLAAAVACSAVAATGHAAPTASREGTVTIARLVVATPVRADPRGSSRLVTTIAAVRPLTRQQTALPVIEEAHDGTATHWLKVRLPGRPNGRTGWIRAGSARLASSPWRVVVIRARREAVVLKDGKIFERLRIVIGKPATPTPRGDFFVIEHVVQTGGSPLGRWALATSAHSNVLQEFDGGPGQIALHGRRGPLALDPLGTAASHGCVRFDNAAIDRLSRLLPNGTPIEIR
jgi:lipoprotein-anchoring transpeptidase ErfK/SrfK